MPLNVTFTPSAALRDALKAVADRLGDCSEPLAIIMKRWRENVVAHVMDEVGMTPLHPRSVEPPTGPHHLLILTHKMIDAFIPPRVYKFAAFLVNVSPTAILHERGRTKGEGAVRETKRTEAYKIRTGKRLTKRASRMSKGAVAKAKAEGRRTAAWQAMDARPFLYVDDVMGDDAVDEVFKWTLEEWGG
jgi:hypothetical protein